jgi:uncharacterized iron-regulated membrane protein
MSLLKSLLRKRRKKESLFKYVMGILHLWLGLLSSLIIFVVCLTGTLYVFRNQILDLYNSDKVYVKAEGNRIPLDSLRKQFTDKNLEITTLVIPANPKKSLVITYTDQITKISKTHYFNPYTGAELGAADRGLDSFFAVVLDIHKNILLSNTGKQIVGVATLIFCFMLFSGFVLWLPKKWKNLKDGLRIKWKAKFYRVNYDLHNTLGFYALLMLFFIAITGLYVTYPWMKSTIIVSLGGEPVLTAGAGEKANEAASNAFADLLQKMVNKQEDIQTTQDVKPISLDSITMLTNRHLNYKATTLIQLPDDQNPWYSIQKINTQNWLGAQLPDHITFDKKGELKTLELFADKPLHKQFVEISKPLHTGEIMGLPSAILYFIVALIGCMLPITGFIIWWKKVK